ncbi:hypothetical protein [Kiloniella litopenaei]|uniref:hypothetical protein n=1 Tax=Kiloniella litopenaei TaxID=1549748 RepID=UPI003BAA37B6
MTDYKYSHKVTIEAGKDIPEILDTEVAIQEDNQTFIYEDISDNELQAFEQWVFDTFECYEGKELVREGRSIWID